MKITDVKAILTAPGGIDLVVVKVETSTDGLYGLGCATFTQRALAVKTAVEEYLKPFLVGKDPRAIEDIFKSSMVNSYWRNGPVLNNAISGVDMALWDILGKLAHMPLYMIFGGKMREGVAAYTHADGNTPREVTENAARLVDRGFMNVRCQMGQYGGKSSSIRKPRGAAEGAYFNPEEYARTIPEMFEYVRDQLGYGVNLLHDIHERLQPAAALRLAKDLEPFRLFFLEDPLPPEQIEWFKILREGTTIPLAMGELFNNPLEWKGLIVNHLIDYIRVHISQIGGITPARKLAAFCEQFGVRTAWHGPGDVSPVGHAANIHLDLSLPNFGIQEWVHFCDELMEVFPGIPQFKDGYIYCNDKPGLGIDLDEEKAKKYPCKNEVPRWTVARTPDGTIVNP